MRGFRADSDTLFPWGDDYRSKWVNCNENKSFTGVCAIDATPQDISPFQVYNMVGNVVEYVRDAANSPGADREFHYGKGNCYSAPGYVQGLATFRWEIYSGTDRVGFRCVKEEP